MKQIVDYSELEGDDKKAKALEDIVGYLGWKRFFLITAAMHADRKEFGKPPTTGRFRLMLAMAGVQGYPVKVWYEHTYGEPWPEKDKENG